MFQACSVLTAETIEAICSFYPAMEAGGSPHRNHQGTSRPKHKQNSNNTNDANTDLNRFDTAEVEALLQRRRLSGQ